jgi:pre-mRNA-splicing helicase BRR2
MLAQAQTNEEKKSIEEKMTSDTELSGYLRALGATDKEDLVTEERTRRQQVRQSRVAADIEAMDVDQSQVCEGGLQVTRFVEVEGLVNILIGDNNRRLT